MIINIITNLHNYKDNIIIDNDGFFNENVTAHFFSDLEKQIIYEIDKAELLDANTGMIKTPRGICAIENLSTGCKTIINYLFVIKHKEFNRFKAIDASYCGANALATLFNTMEKVKIPLNIVLRHRDNLHECGTHQYLIDGERIINNLLFI